MSSNVVSIAVEFQFGIQAFVSHALKKMERMVVRKNNLEPL